MDVKEQKAVAELLKRLCGPRANFSFVYGAIELRGTVFTLDTVLKRVTELYPDVCVYLSDDCIRFH